MVGHWQPQNKFLCMYRKLDELGEQVEDLDSRTMDLIGNRAKELNRDLEDILRRLQTMDYINYDKNKIDFLYEILEKAMENEEHVEIVLDRLRSLEKIHKESPNIDSSIKTLKARQELIDRAFKSEDAEILKTKKQFLDAMNAIQVQLKEVPMLQKNSERS